MREPSLAAKLGAEFPRNVRAGIRRVWSRVLAAKFQLEIREQTA